MKPRLRQSAWLKMSITALCWVSGSAIHNTANAAEGFKVRFPLSGTLGGEMVAHVSAGWFGSMVATNVSLDKVSDDSGKQRSAPTSASSISVGQTTLPYSYQSTIDADFSQTQNFYNFYGGYTTTRTFAGGHFSFALNIPYSTAQRNLRYFSQTPSLYTADGTPVESIPQLFGGKITGAQVQSLFANAYQARIAAKSDEGSGQVRGFGDVELTSIWAYDVAKLKVGTGLTLSLPTGDYDTNPSAINIGYGRFYTLRPGSAIAYQVNEKITLGARASLGLNSENTLNHWRSGNFYAVECAATYLTPIGIIGPHYMKVHQFQADSGAFDALGNALGANRFGVTGIGGFFTTLIRPLNTAINFTYMRVIESQNAMSGNFVQMRLSKRF